MVLSSLNFYIFLILILLLSLIGLYWYFHTKLLKQRRNFTEALQKTQKSEENKNALLSSMGDDIYQLTKTLVSKEDSKEESLEEEILTSANNLRELLKIQANTIEIYQENFTFSHMLDDISTYLSSNFEPRETEVIYDIDSTVPQRQTGDIIHLSRIINNLLEFSFPPQNPRQLPIFFNSITLRYLLQHILIVSIATR